MAARMTLTGLVLMIVVLGFTAHAPAITSGGVSPAFRR